MGLCSQEIEMQENESSKSPNTRSNIDYVQEILYFLEDYTNLRNTTFLRGHLEFLDGPKNWPPSIFR